MPILLYCLYSSTPEDLDAILSCNLRIVSLRLKFRNYFLQHNQPIKETFKNMEKYIDHLRNGLTLRSS